ncbi:MAG TPA: L-myo-inositol-1-phosphate synthase, partial [archaeon]|nr:L-myo-inositol-1-phosphate synthase [archaeon]
ETGNLDVKVLKGPVLDGVSEDLSNIILVDDSKPVNISKELIDSDVDVLVNLLPVGASKASRFYADEALKAGCAFVNCTPAKIANDKKLATKFMQAKLPVIGDDLMSQIGGTIFHKSILDFFNSRGVKVKSCYQLDVGGGTESRATIEESRKMLKRGIKTDSIRSVLPYKFNIVSGTTDYVEFLGNKRVSYYWLKGEYFNGAPVMVDIYLRTLDGPNCGSIIFDVVRACKIALGRKTGGILPSICAYGFKDSPKKIPLNDVKKEFIQFVEGKNKD